MKNKLKQFKNWVSGFFKKEYEYELPNQPIYDDVDLIMKMGESLSPILSTINDMQIDNVRFGIYDYSIKKEYNNELKDKLVDSDTCISFIKSSVETMVTGQKEIEVLTTVFCLGIDNEVWKIEFKPYFLYDCFSSEFDTSVIQLCVDLANLGMDVLNLHVMTKQKPEVSNIWETDLLGERTFTGTINTFGSFTDFQIFGIDEILPDPFINDAKMYQDAIHNFSIDETLEEESLIFDVIKKEKQKNYVSDEFIEAMKEFNIDVLHDRTIEDLLDGQEVLKEEDGG